MITQSAYEEIIRYHEFRRSDGQGYLTSEETISNVDVVITEKETGADMSATMLDNIGIYNNTKAMFTLKNVESGKRYYLDIKIITSNGQRMRDAAPYNHDLIVAGV